MSCAIMESLGFHPIIERWFKERFTAPSPPQKDGWPSIAAGNHTLILAPTGSGKTLAAFLWSIDRLFRKSKASDTDTFDRNPSGVHTLYISPLKALNNDIRQNLETPLKEIELQDQRKQVRPAPIRVTVRTGDTPPHVRRSMLQKPPHILITTPESLYLLLTSQGGRGIFRELQYVIVDEIHALSGNKRGVHLSLSLERLMELCQSEPVRIGLSATQRPLERIAAYLGGLKFDPVKKRFRPRPVTIIDCGRRKDLDLQVITPVKSFRELPEASVWQPVYQMLYGMIQKHGTTLIFAGMRAQTEKIARELNRLHRHLTGDPEAILALAHHGSISRQARYDTENRLKTGTIPAVVATTSLELGIDIGTIDLVVQLQAPASVSSALQRVGRSGHLLSATSKGRIVVLYPADLDDATAIAACMQQGDIEEIRIPQNPLDVLAQQITAEVAMKSWSVEDLYHLVLRSYCYRNLPEPAYRKVLDMLSGKQRQSPLAVLTPRLTWDRINNRLIARRGSRLAAVMNGGTIPDRGYFGVYLENSNVKLGEVEEEFVFESRVSEVFFLGNSEWLIKRITADRVIVSPSAAIHPRAPFWKGDILHRDYATSKKIGSFRRKLIEMIRQGIAHRWLLEKYPVDENTAVNLVDYFRRQQKKGQAIATDNRVVAEKTIDSGGEPLLILHAAFGARVNGAWAIALAAALEHHYQTQIQYSFDDDAILIRLPETSQAPPFDWLFSLPAKKIEKYLLTTLPHTPVFQVHFRYNAGRSLMLPRSHPGRRIPLWLQRLRASDLLQAVGRQPDFPVMAETYRQCLQDVFDLTTLKGLIAELLDGRIVLKQVDTSAPSPMAAGLLFKFVSVHLYEMDQDRRVGQLPLAGGELLYSILDQPEIPTLVTPDLVAQAERRWQHLDPQFQAASREEVFDIIEKLGPMDKEDLVRRCKSDPGVWLAELKAAGRIGLSEHHADGTGRRRWRAEVRNDAGTDAAIGANDVCRHLQQYLQVHGPVTLERLAGDLELPRATLTASLEAMRRNKGVVHGNLTVGTSADQWCSRQNFAMLYRMAVARRRSIQSPADRPAYNRFLIEWHLGSEVEPVEALVRRYRGLHFPLFFFEREILFSRSRYGSRDSAAFKDNLAQFEKLISDGHLIVLPGRSADQGNRYVKLRLRGEGYSFADVPVPAVVDLDTATRTVLNFLQNNGASYGRDIQWATDLPPAALNTALQQLADIGLAACEDYRSFTAIFQSPAPAAHPIAGRDLPARTSQHRRRASRSDIRQAIVERGRIRDGRWFLTNSPAVIGKRSDPDQIAFSQARLLLHRHGILVKEWYRRENGLLPWHRIFQNLKRLEWQGEIRRGYFVSGLSGLQFALPDALELLEAVMHRPKPPNSEPVLLSTLDPALPFGGTTDWGIEGPNGHPVKITRAASNHLLIIAGRVVLVCEHYFQRIRVLEDLPPDVWDKFAYMVSGYLKMPLPLRPANRIEISEIDTRPASASPVAMHLLNRGFEKDGGKLVLWPSAV